MSLNLLMPIKFTEKIPIIPAWGLKFHKNLCSKALQLFKENEIYLD